MSLNQVVTKIIAQYFDRLPYLKRPATAYAKVTGVTKISDTTWEYTIKLMSEQLLVDSLTPEIPGIKSTLEIKSGKTVAVVMMYGQLKPFIVGEAFI